MNKNLRWIFALLAITSTSVTQAKLEAQVPVSQLKPDSVLATVNGMEIRGADVMKVATMIAEQLQQRGADIPAEKKREFYNTILGILIDEAVQYEAAVNDKVDQIKEVREKITEATKKIVVNHYMNQKRDTQRTQLKDGDIEKAAEELIAKSGDQLTLLFAKVANADAKRIEAKINEQKTEKDKRTQWNLLSKTYGDKTMKEMGPESILIKDLPPEIKEKFENARAGSVIVLPMPNSTAKDTTLMFVEKREKLSGQLLKNAMHQKISEMIEEGIRKELMQSAKVERSELVDNTAAASAPKPSPAA
jgi:hypothetical protein